MLRFVSLNQVPFVLILLWDGIPKVVISEVLIVFFSFLLSVIMYKIGLVIFHESSALAAKSTLEYLWCV